MVLIFWERFSYCSGLGTFSLLALWFRNDFSSWRCVFAVYIFLVQFLFGVWFSLMRCYWRLSPSGAVLSMFVSSVILVFVSFCCCVIDVFLRLLCRWRLPTVLPPSALFFSLVWRPWQPSCLLGAVMLAGGTSFLLCCRVVLPFLPFSTLCSSCALFLVALFFG